MSGEAASSAHPLVLGYFFPKDFQAKERLLTMCFPTGETYFAGGIVRGRSLSGTDWWFLSILAGVAVV